MSVSKKLGYNCRLGDDLPIIVDGRHQAAWIDGEVFFGARCVEVNYFFLEWEAQFSKSDMCAMSPRASVTAIILASLSEVQDGAIEASLLSVEDNLGGSVRAHFD